MKTNRCWVRIIPGRFFSRALLSSLLLACAHAQTLDTLVRNARASQRPGDLVAIQRLAHSKDATGGLALLATGILEYERHNSTASVETLKQAEKRVPQLADYAAYYRQAAYQDLGQFTEAEDQFHAVSRVHIGSPLLKRAALGAARADIAAQKPAEAVDLLQKHFEAPDPRAFMLLGTAAEAQHDPRAAAVYYQQAYYGFPSAPEATDAEVALQRLAQSNTLPPPTTKQVLTRAYVLLDKGDPLRARKELLDALPYLQPADRELAQVRIGASEYMVKENAGCIRTLNALRVSDPAADAERLYYLFAAARRLDQESDARRMLDELSRLYPSSTWRVKALSAQGNHFLLTNDIAQYTPLFRACYEALPNDPLASSCHWKVAWAEYVQRDANAGSMFKEDLSTYPTSEHANAALYYLGRSAEEARDPGTARVYYQEIVSRFPNTYYAVLARASLSQAKVREASAPATAIEFVASIPFPARLAKLNFAGTPATSARLERARLLTTAGLDDLAEGELRYGAQLDGQPHIMALELAQNADRRGQADQAIRYIKHFVPEYLNIPIEDAPHNFWQYAFPLPYRRELEADCRERSLDPYLVAALIRQESEFNPNAISRSKAYGLTQVLPSTGRQLSKKLGVRRFQTAMLFNPAVNLNLGTFYLRQLLSSLEGHWEATLASYNAGKSRAVTWLGWNQYREPSEFVESIPFTETRNYVQIVLRNADMYRRLYAGKAAGIISPNGNASDKQADVRRVASTTVSLP